jgi:hypothetical protein
VIPNVLHPYLVSYTEGRRQQDTFPTFFRSNTKRTIQRLARQSSFAIESCNYLSQYPNYFLFSRTLFYLGMAYERTVTKFFPTLRGWLMVQLRSI